MKRKVWSLRKGNGPARSKSWPTIAVKVRDLAGEIPYWKACRDGVQAIQNGAYLAEECMYGVQAIQNG